MDISKAMMDASARKVWRERHKEYVQWREQLTALLPDFKITLPDDENTLHFDYPPLKLSGEIDYDDLDIGEMKHPYWEFFIFQTTGPEEGVMLEDQSRVKSLEGFATYIKSVISKLEAK